ncbi:reverse transcriptase [Gossypium australe]|uniref:Reverse transcriptase n=1 Tax=Gossypium australe TaxID=47621 RepID=A0A5B6VCZ4_9ROSI|nr:reverse transcriptase [Gossypium australe]
MGFKEFEAFNLAMLAKQSWRMIAEPRPLWVKVLKGLYFPHKSIMEAEKGSRASWIWRSLVEGS